MIFIQIPRHWKIWQYQVTPCSHQNIKYHPVAVFIFVEKKIDIDWRLSSDSFMLFHLPAESASEKIARWTFFRVKLVFDCDFEISWFLGPLDLGTLGPLPSSNTSSSFPLHPLTSFYLFLLLFSFGMVWYGGGGNEFWHWRLRLTIRDGPLTFILMLKSYGVVVVVGGGGGALRL